MHYKNLPSQLGRDEYTTELILTLTGKQKAIQATKVARHYISVTWAGGICLICMHEHEGMQHLRASATYQANPNCTCYTLYICYVTLPAL